MRDIVLALFILSLLLAAFKRPWLGVVLWVWLGLMNPHRYMYGFAYSFPWAQLTILVFFVSLFLAKERYNLLAGKPMVWLLAFVIWMTISWLLGLDLANDYEEWTRVMKVMLMVFMLFAVMRSKFHILALVWTCALSVALVGLKGGVFTVLTGGSYRVWGPPGSAIYDNNEFALALSMTIPLLWFLRQQLMHRHARLVLMVMMVLCAFAALGTQSRGGLLAMAAMATVLWWRGGSRFVGGIVIVVAAFMLVAFMPSQWTDRMNTMNNDYSEDASAKNRVSAWWVSWGIAKDYVTGVGFVTARPELFLLYSPYPETGTWVAHSIYFQVMGNHGFIGLGIFLMVFVSAWWSANRVRRAARRDPRLLWCSQLAGMCQVSLVGYAVGGAFLSLAYFDLPYYIVAVAALTDLWVRQRRWETETEPMWRGWRLPGMAARGGA
jgi:putative inorganic carbon (HCO3(-)) transporter